jgi:hypothetical protein
MPLLRIVANEVITLACQFVFASDFSSGIGFHERQLQDSVGRWHDRLALIRFKAERQLP